MGIFVALLGCAVPAFLQAWWFGYSSLEYSAFQASNWMWTMVAAGDGELWGTPAAPITVVISAVLIFGLNLVFTMYEVEHVRQATPQRVLDDESELDGGPAKVVTTGG
jgi:hypothetical protein